MACEWWIGTGGVNYLKGDYVNCDNPPLLCDEWIVEILRTNQTARASFLRILGNMLPDEQIRLRTLLEAATDPAPDPRDVEDAFQRGLNTKGIHTVGRLGGVGY